MYCQIEDIRKQISLDTLIQLTDDNQTGEIDIEIAEEAINYSGTLINGYLIGRYNIPINNEIPDIVKIVAIDLSIYRLYSRRFQTDMPDSVSEKYKNSMKILEQIQKGIISLSIDATDSVIKIAIYKTNKTYQDRIFSDEVLDGY